MPTTPTIHAPADGRASPHAIARWCAAQGWYVHPLAAGMKIPVANCVRCRAPKPERDNPLYIKHTPAECRCIPAGRPCHGVWAATRNPRLIDHWWSMTPQPGVGVAAGASNLLILDLDMHATTPPQAEALLPGLNLSAAVDLHQVRHGADVLALLCKERRTGVPQTFAVRTPSGGLHLWFTVADGHKWRMDSQGRLGWQIDIRADRSYAVAPGTQTRAGLYTPVGDRRAPAPLPRWLAHDLARVGLRHRTHTPAPAAARRPKQVPVSLPASVGERTYVAAAVRGELEAVANCRAGRNDQLCKSAFALGTFVGAGLLDGAEVHRALTEAAQQAGIDPHERKAQDTIARSIADGARHPRRIGAPA